MVVLVIPQDLSLNTVRFRFHFTLGEYGIDLVHILNKPAVKAHPLSRRREPADNVPPRLAQALTFSHVGAVNSLKVSVADLERIGPRIKGSRRRGQWFRKSLRLLRERALLL